jgi:hypothetical protein
MAALGGFTLHASFGAAYDYLSIMEQDVHVLDSTSPA